MSAPPPYSSHAADGSKQEKALVDNQSVSSLTDDDRVLQEIGYVPSFKREFSNLATVRIQFCPDVMLSLPLLRSE
jgi:hypothetical protein